MSSGSGKAFELSISFYEEFLSTKEPNRPQKVVTSGCEVIISGLEKCVKTGTPTFGIRVKLENIRKIFQPFDSQYSKIIAWCIEIRKPHSIVTF